MIFALIRTSEMNISPFSILSPTISIPAIRPSFKISLAATSWFRAF
jgi:hypothetical protein